MKRLAVVLREQADPQRMDAAIAKLLKDLGYGR